MDAPEPQTWFNGAIGLIMALFGLVGSMFRSQLSEIRAEQAALLRLSANFITRDEHQKYIDQVRGDRIQMHVENLGRLDRLDDAIIRLAEKWDRR